MFTCQCTTQASQGIFRDWGEHLRKLKEQRGSAWSRRGVMETSPLYSACLLRLPCSTLAGRWCRWKVRRWESPLYKLLLEGKKHAITLSYRHILLCLFMEQYRRNSVHCSIYLQILSYSATLSSLLCKRKKFLAAKKWKAHTEIVEYTFCWLCGYILLTAYGLGLSIYEIKEF